MKNKIFYPYFLIICIGLISLTSCETKKPAIPRDLAKQQLIPKPVNVNATGSSFEINGNTSIQYQSDEVQPVATYLAEILRPATGFEIPVKVMDSKPSSDHIFLTLTDSITSNEGYELITKENGIVIKANKPAGLFYGVQTLRQLLKKELKYLIPC